VAGTSWFGSVVPVWFRWHGGAVTLCTTEARVWVRNLMGEPRVAFSVQTFQAPYPAVSNEGAPPSRPRTTTPRSRRPKRSPDAAWPPRRSTTTWRSGRTCAPSWPWSRTESCPGRPEA